VSSWKGAPIEAERLDPLHRDHQLTGDYVGRRECHIEADWLLINLVLVYRLTFSKKLVIPAPYQVRGKLQPESSLLKGLWMPPYQVRGRLLKSGMTD